jgi:hypothetical protein
MIVGNIGVRQRAVSSGAFLHEAIRAVILIVALQSVPKPAKDQARRHQPAVAPAPFLL